MRCRDHWKTEPLKPLLFALVILTSYGEGNVVDRRPRVLNEDLSVEQRKDCCVSGIAIGDPEKGGVIEAFHDFETDHILIEGLAPIKIVDSQDTSPRALTADIVVASLANSLAPLAGVCITNRGSLAEGRVQPLVMQQ
jgi:hypothetical protein